MVAETTTQPSRQPAADADVRFAPLTSAVNDVISVQGFNWQPGPITVYLVPESERVRLDAADPGVLFVLGESDATATGMFTVNLVVPPELSSEDGARRITVGPGRYAVAARGADGLRVAVTTLTIR
jgi:hypothetical protein